jgi:hypothetical protein
VAVSPCYPATTRAPDSAGNAAGSVALWWTLYLWVPRTMSRGLTWPHTAGPGAVSPTFGCADTSRSGTVGTRDPTLRLPGIAANARLDGPSRTVRSGQRRRDLGPATPDRRSPALRQDTRSSWADRAILSALAQLIPSRQRSQLRLIASSRTLLRWHADIVKRRWCYLWVPETLSRHATWAYSWRRPPSLSRRMTLTSSSMGSGSARSGLAWFSARCGRCCAARIID